jgi:hypothetical protein
MFQVTFKQVRPLFLEPLLVVFRCGKKENLCKEEGSPVAGQIQLGVCLSLWQWLFWVES